MTKARNCEALTRQGVHGPEIHNTMANHSSTGTTQLYDRRSDVSTLDKVERVLI